MTTPTTTWIQTHSGVAFDLANPRPEDVRIEDIAHALSLLNRFTGHCAWPYSVAQHSIMVAEIVVATAPELGLVALLHDAHEAYVGDVSTPLKRAMASGEAYSQHGDVAYDVDRAVHLRFIGNANTARPEWQADRRLIKHADLVALATERRDLLGPSPRDGWGAATGCVLPEPLEARCEEWPWQMAKQRFLDAFERFGGK